MSPPNANSHPSGTLRARLTRVHNLVKIIEPWSILLASVALLLSVTQFYLEIGDRVREREVRAWQLLTTDAPGNSGKIAALEYLNGEDGWLCFDWLNGRLGFLHGPDAENTGCVFPLKIRTPLVGIDLSGRPAVEKEGPDSLRPQGVFLRGVNLPNVDLSNANLSGAILFEANLNDANLREADLGNADLVLADLRRTNLVEANLSGAILSSARLDQARLEKAELVKATLIRTRLDDANLSGANLTNANLGGAGLTNAVLAYANLSGADLGSARGLSQDQIDEACADADTPPKLPPSLTWKDQPCD